MPWARCFILILFEEGMSAHGRDAAAGKHTSTSQALDMSHILRRPLSPYKRRCSTRTEHRPCNHQLNPWHTDKVVTPTSFRHFASSKLFFCMQSGDKVRQFHTEGLRTHFGLHMRANDTADPVLDPFQFLPFPFMSFDANVVVSDIITIPW
jgi:hypothetical protein